MGALAIDMTRIWLFFGGSIDKLFALRNWGPHMLFQKKNELNMPMPKFGP